MSLVPEPFQISIDDDEPELEVGRHFAAVEQPELFVSELRTCFREMRR